MNSANHVVWRWCLSGGLRTDTPLIIGSGETRNADVQCIRDSDGKFFIPGTTIAGVLRHSLPETCAGLPLLDRAFGEAKDDGRQSLLLFHDAPLSSGERQRAAVRDGVALDYKTKTALDKKKFDYEVIDRGQVFDFRMEALLREKDIVKDGMIASMKELLDRIVALLAGGGMRIGAKRSRGFGKVVLENPRLAVFDFSDPSNRKSEGERWLRFDWSETQLETFDAPNSGAPSEYISVCAGFDIPGAMFIRSYSIDPAAPDAVHIRSGEVPVIPGTSWAGALRHAMFNLGRAMGACERMEALIRSLFGEVREETNGACASNIVVDESEIMGAGQLEYTRNKIDRFTGGVAPSALFTEKPSFGGTVELNCLVRKEFYAKNPVSSEEIPSPEACVGALLLAVLDIGGGIQPVGGAGSVGRGLLALRSLVVDGENMLKEPESSALLDHESAGAFLRAAAEYLGRGRS